MATFATALLAAPEPRHVVVVVWDGMRPDFVSRETTPTLFTLAETGVTFARHHCVYVSSTEVNGTALATGMYPEQSGIIANNEFRPAIQGTKSIMTADFNAVRKGDGTNANHYLGSPTLAEILHHQGLSTAIAGAKPVTLLQDRNAETNGALGITIFEGKALPDSFTAKLSAALGAFPAPAISKIERDLWTTRALIGPLWEKGVPAFSLLWLSEPDNSQHQTGPGSKTSLRALKSSDDNLARVLAALEHRRVLDKTDVIVVSDHGFSTISQKVNVTRELRKSGFKPRQKFRSKGPRENEILVVGNGGAVFFYIPDQDPFLAEKLVHWLQAQPWSGVLFTRKPVEGTLSLETARINSPDAPDIVLSMRWSSEPSATSAPGLVCSDCAGWFFGYGCGRGIHSSLSPYDLHNTCIAAGPDFRKGFRDEVPTGNIDIMPTVLWLLGVQPAEKPSGRVLKEALLNFTGPEPSVSSHRVEAAYRARDFLWRQTLDYSEVDGVVYFEKGNGIQEPR